MVPKTMSTDGSDNNSEADLPWENLDSTPNDHPIVADEEKTNCVLDKQRDPVGLTKDDSAISEAIDEKVCSTNFVPNWSC